MTRFTRRTVLKAGVAASAVGVLPRFAVAQADDRPSITIAVQQIVNANTLEPLREQSNVGTRLMTSLFECLIEQDLQRELQQIPGLATEWKRIDDRTVEREGDRNCPGITTRRCRPGCLRRCVPQNLGVQRRCTLDVGIAEKRAARHRLVAGVLYPGAGRQSEAHRHTHRVRRRCDAGKGSGRGTGTRPAAG